jgi:Domain of unknown function (DUF1906)
MLPGHIQSAPPNAKGFDANTPIGSVAVAQAFANSGFKFCIRYLAHGPHQGLHDLSNVEATNILQGGLAVMPVQHVRQPGWVPNQGLGTQDGQFAAQHAGAIGFPSGVNVWCDLEGVANGTSAAEVIAYCNAWYDAVHSTGFVPGIYVGADAILSADQLYHLLKFQHYWKSLSHVPPIPVRGYQMTQTAGGTVHGIAIDNDMTQTDNKGGQAQWLIV